MARRLNAVDKQYVAENLHTKTDDEIAKVLDCSERTVYRIRCELKEARETGSVDDVTKSKIMDEHELAAHYKREFEISPRGKRIKRLVTSDEFEEFVEEWVAFHLQLDDVSHSEQNTVEQMIFLKLRMNESQRQYKVQIERERKLLDDANVATIDDLDSSDPDHIEMINQITLCNSTALNMNKDYRESLDRHTKLSESLNVTRRQREEKGRVGGDTFFSKCQEFTQRNIREREGRMAELLRVATDKNMDKLRNGITFMDGEVAPQLLDSETIELMDKQKEQSSHE